MATNWHQKGNKTAPKWHHNGTIMAPYSTRMAPQWHHNGTSMAPVRHQKGTCKAPKRHQKWHQIGTIMAPYSTKRAPKCFIKWRDKIGFSATDARFEPQKMRSSPPKQCELVSRQLTVWQLPVRLFRRLRPVRPPRVPVEWDHTWLSHPRWKFQMLWSRRTRRY